MRYDREQQPESNPADGEASDERDSLDVRLLHAVAQGDLTALEPLYIRYRPLVMTALRRHGGARAHELEDLCHDVFLSLQHAAGGFRRQSTVRAFIVGIAVRTGWKRGFRASLHRSLLGRLFDQPDEVPSAHGALEAAEQTDRLLSRLPEAQRTVLLLHQVEHLSGEEIAHALNISVNTVWTRLHRARERLRELEAELERASS